MFENLAQTLVAVDASWLNLARGDKPKQQSDRGLLAGERRLGFRPASKLAVEILQSIGRSNRFPHGTREFVEGQQLITGLL